MTGKRLLGLVMLLGALLFALMGGEYSTPQWRGLRRSELAERATVAQLQREVDSLARLRKLVLTDPATQERIAREQYGMLRKGEREITLVRPQPR